MQNVFPVWITKDLEDKQNIVVIFYFVLICKRNNSL